MNKQETIEKLERILSRAVVENGDGRANLNRADLSGADLRGDDLSWADLSGANLSGANLSRANLNRADLSGADLRGANLSGANLSGANLSRANLNRADLSGADLSGANLNRADLSGADLSGANLSVANLSWATGDTFIAFNAGRFNAVFTATHGHIGCERHTLARWRGNFEAIGRENHFTAEEVEDHRVMIFAAIAVMEARAKRSEVNTQ